MFIPTVLSQIPSRGTKTPTFQSCTPTTCHDSFLGGLCQKDCRAMLAPHCSEAEIKDEHINQPSCPVPKPSHHQDTNSSTTTPNIYLNLTPSFNFNFPSQHNGHLPHNYNRNGSKAPRFPRRRGASVTQYGPPPPRSRILPLTASREAPNQPPPRLNLPTTPVLHLCRKVPPHRRRRAL